MLERLAISFIVLTVVFLVGCQAYEPFSPTKELSWRMNASKSTNPIFVENYDHEFLWKVVADVIDNHFDIERELPIRLFDGVLTTGYIETEPKIGASLAEPWHVDSVGFRERVECTLQTIRRRAELHVEPVSGGYSIEIKVFKELENNPTPLHSASNASNLRFRESVDEFSEATDVEPSASSWYVIERDIALENRLLMEIAYRLKHPPNIIRHAKEPIR